MRRGDFHKELTPHDQKGVWRMFNSIAPYYDFLNHLLSLNIDRYWRRFAVDLLVKHSQVGTYLDLAAGTGDVSFTLLRRHPDSKVVAVDPAEKMLAIFREKSLKRGVDNRAFAVVGDGLGLPLPDSSLAGAIVAFGIRNIPDRVGVLREMARVVRRGGAVVVLEFSKPRGLFGLLYDLYFHRVLPLLGRIISRDPLAYSYLPKTVEGFPKPSEFAGMMVAAGLERVRYWSLTGEIVVCYLGVLEGRLER